MKYITCLLLSVGLIACNNNTQEAGPVINEPNNKLVMDGMIGTWLNEDGKSFERWTKINDSLYQSVVFTINGTDTAWKERAVVFGKNENWIFENVVSGQNEGQAVSFTSTLLEIEPTGVSGIISARFLPEGLAPFLTVPVNSLENRAVSMSELFGQAGSQLELEVIQADTNQDRIQLIENFLLSILSKPVVAAGITRSCVEVIMAAQGQLGISDLAQKMKLNRRQLERKFESEIGMSPKQLSRAIRLQATIRKLGEKKFNTLTDLAYDNGYYDQAHFIRDFREFTGISPRSFFSGNMQFAALFASAE